MATPAASSPAPPAPVDAAARRARLAVAALFAVNGMVLANIVPWFPVIKQELGLSNAAFGLAIAAGPAGGLLLGPVAGPLAARFGSGRTATRSALLQLLALPAVALAPSWVGFAGALFLMGSTDAVTDAAMNAHALRVQRRYRRSIINGFHALWSLGAVGGGLLGAAMIALDVPRPVHLIGVGVLLAVLVLGTARWLLPGPEDAELMAGAAAPVEGAVADVGDGAGGAQRGRGDGLRGAVRAAPWLLLGIAGLPMMSGAIEDAAPTWAAVHLRETLDASPFVAGLGFVAAQAMMVVGRVLGDRVVDRFGARAVARSGSLLAALGMAAVVMGHAPPVVIVGFALSGLGASTLFPLGFAAAGDIPGVRSADGVAIVSWLARTSFLVLPPTIGLVADATSLRVGLSLVVGCALVAAALSGLLPDRTRPQAPAAD